MGQTVKSAPGDTGLFGPNDLSLSRPRSAALADDGVRERILALVDRFYPFLAMPSVARLVGSSVISRNYLISSDMGRFALKERVDSESADRLDFEVELGLKLLTNGIPVAESVPAARGARVVQYDASRWVLYRFVRGTHFTGGPGELEAAGHAFAGLTDALARVLPSEESFASDGDFLHGLDSFLCSGARDIADRKIKEVLERHRRTIVVGIDAVAAEIARIEERRGPVHLDFHPANLIYRGRSIACILDLEDVRSYPLLPAVGFAAFKLIRQAMVNSAVRARERRAPGLASSWLRGWGEARTGSRYSTQELGLGARYRILVMIHTILQHHVRGDNRFSYDFRKQVMSLLEADEIFGVSGETLSESRR